MTRPTFEFPRFDYDLPEIPGFVDTSWHNDICPSLTRTDPDGDESRTLILWCDYADKAEREDAAMARFTLMRGEYGTVNQITLYEGEDLADALAAVAVALADGAALRVVRDSNGWSLITDDGCAMYTTTDVLMLIDEIILT